MLPVWFNKTRLAKFVAIFAALLLLSIGLCGANAFVFSKFGSFSGPADPHRPAWLSMLLMATGAFELLGAAIGAIGLVVTLLLLLAYWIHVMFIRKHD